MKKLAVALLAMVAINSAVAANWVQVGEGKRDGGYTYSLDVDTVKKLSAYSKQIFYFAKHDYNKAQKTADGKYYNYAIWQTKGDCDNNRSSIMGYILYTRNGSVVDSNNRSNDDWQPVFPDTIGEAILNAACYVAGYREEP